MEKIPYLLKRLKSMGCRRAKWVIQLVRHLGMSGKPGQHVFISGVQRSGTNMMMDILDRSFETDVYHERDERAFYKYRMREWQVIHKLFARSRAQSVVIKALCESDHLRDLLEEFVPARAVWIVRNYDDVVNSMQVSFPNHVKKIQHIVTDHDPGDWMVQNMSTNTRALVSKLYHPEITEVSAAALIWYLRNVLYFDQDLEHDRRVRLIRYESAVADPEISLKGLFDFLELGYSPRLVKEVSERSVKRHPAPDIEPVIRTVCDQLNMRFNTVIESQRDPGT